MRYFASKNSEHLSNFLHAIAAIPFGLATLAVASHLIIRMI